MYEYRNRTRYLTSEVPTPGVYGSNRAGQILSDAVAGTDSVDIVIFGDSNSGSSASCGYTVGWQMAMTAMGAPTYATPLSFCCSEDGTNNRVGGLFMPWNYYGWSGRSTAGAVGTLYTMTNRLGAGADADASALNSLFDNYFIRENTARASSATTIQLDVSASSIDDAYTGNGITILSGAVGSNATTNYAIITGYDGTNKTATVAGWPGGTPSGTASFLITKALLRPSAFSNAVAYVPAAGTFTSGANGPSVRMVGGNQLVNGPTGGAGVALQYRVVYGKFATTGGKFRLRAMKGVNTFVAGSAADIPTSGGVGYDTAKLDFTSSTTTGVPDEMKCAWDGWNATPNSTWQVTGPFAAFYHSVIRTNYKGFCVSNLNYFGGATTAFLAATLAGATKYLEAFLKELRQRQIEAGGSGRVVWWSNSGINGPDTGSTWTTNSAAIRDTVYNVWVNTLGYPARDLAFVMSVSHPVVAGDPGAGTWGTTRAAVATAANNWASQNEADGKNVTVVDIESVLTAAQIKSRNLYQNLSNTLYAAHLRNGPTIQTAPTYSPTTFTGLGDAVAADNGYAVVTTGILRKLLA